MAKVFGIGETVYDILFKNNAPVGAVPGGSVYNSIVSLGRAGVPAAFISEVGNDRVGEIILEHLRDSGVDTSAVCFRWNSPRSRGAIFFSVAHTLCSTPCCAAR